MKIKTLVFVFALAIATKGFAVDSYITGSVVEPCAPATVQACEPTAIAPCEPVKIEPCAPVANIEPCAPVASYDDCSCDSCNCAARVVAKRQRVVKGRFIARWFKKRSVTRSVKIETN